jgi:hypothetical protein
VTLSRLLLAWLPVALWFVAVRWLSERRRPPVAGLAGEALVVTLFASLWFDSLGHGEWWLIFLLVGLLVAFPVRLRNLVPGMTARGLLVPGLIDTARYVVAGGILAWRLA